MPILVASCPMLIPLNMMMMCFNLTMLISFNGTQRLVRVCLRLMVHDGDGRNGGDGAVFTLNSRCCLSASRTLTADCREAIVGALSYSLGVTQ